MALAVAGLECQKELSFSRYNKHGAPFDMLSGKELKAMTFRPLYDRVLVRRIDESEKTAGGIIIPDAAKEKPQEGKIISIGKGAVGDDNERVPLEVKPGDHILFGKWSGSEVTIEGEELLILKESDILGIVETRRSIEPAA